MLNVSPLQGKVVFDETPFYAVVPTYKQQWSCFTLLVLPAQRQWRKYIIIIIIIIMIIIIIILIICQN